MIDRIAFAGYRSILSLVVQLGQLSVITGANGSGKSNLYRALKLIADTADGRLVQSLAREGGFESVLWAGPENVSNAILSGDAQVQGTTRSGPISLRLGFTSYAYSYCLDLGLPIPADSMFDRDPELKRECLWRGPVMEAKSMCADRRRSSFRYRGAKGRWQEIELPLDSQRSMLSQFVDPITAPELIVVREMLRSWRFYDSFRTDSAAPARRPAVGTFTPVMSGDGSDLAAALQTIREIGDCRGLEQTIDDAFPGSTVHIQSDAGAMTLCLEQPGMLRKLSAAELSDGTLRYLLLVAALLTPRPPELMVINEPENSLHPELIPALGRLIKLAAENSQIIVVTHNPDLVNELESDEICRSIRLEKETGQTMRQGASLLDQYGWKWPAR